MGKYGPNTNLISDIRSYYSVDPISTYLWISVDLILGPWKVENYSIWGAGPNETGIILRLLAAFVARLAQKVPKKSMDEEKMKERICMNWARREV